MKITWYWRRKKETVRGMLDVRNGDKYRNVVSDENIEQTRAITSSKNTVFKRKATWTEHILRRRNLQAKSNMIMMIIESFHYRI